MKWILGPAARLVEARPWWAIGGIGALTVLLALFAVQQQTDTDITAFAPESEIGRAFSHLEQDMGASDAVQVIIDSGDGNVISVPGIRAVLEIREALEGSPRSWGLWPLPPPVCRLSLRLRRPFSKG